MNHLTIYKAGLNDSIKKSKNGVPYNGGPRQTITVTTDGKVILVEILNEVQV